jgi:hypothetical protein
MMRKQLFLGLAFVSLAGLFVSCGDSTTDPQPPSISLKAGGDYYVANTSVAPGELIKFGVTVTANATSGKKIQNVTVTRTFNNNPDVIVDSSINEDIFVADWEIYASDAAGTETITIVAEDKDAETAEISFTIVTDAGLTKSLLTHSITLGAQDNVTGSFCASFEGTVYTITELKNGSKYADVDIIYYYGATNKSALFSPKAIVANDITWGGAVPVANWTTQNETKFRKAVAVDYNDATYNSVAALGTLADLDLANGGGSPIAGLAVGDYYAFKTADGKNGVFSVNAVSGEAAGTISFTIKIQED